MKTATLLMLIALCAPATASAQQMQEFGLQEAQMQDYGDYSTGGYLARVVGIGLLSGVVTGAAAGALIMATSQENPDKPVDNGLGAIFGAVAIGTLGGAIGGITAGVLLPPPRPDFMPEAADSGAMGAQVGWSVSF